MDKPHRGRIENWSRYPCASGLEYLVCGRFVDHYLFAGEDGHTSAVHSYDEATGEIETRNSRYTLVGPEVKPAEFK